MAAYVKCPYCEKTFDREKIPCIKVGRRYYHEECKKLKDESGSPEEKAYNDLVNYIQQVLGDDYSPVKVDYQIRDFKEKYGFKYSGMLAALIWYYDINKGDKTKANNGIGILPFIYKQAESYWKHLTMAQSQNIDKDLSKYINPTVIKITIQSPQKNIKKPRLFDLE